jgi:hypothetical protein
MIGAHRRWTNRRVAMLLMGVVAALYTVSVIIVLVRN